MIRYEKNEPAADKDPWYACWSGPRHIGNIALNDDREWGFYPIQWMFYHVWSESMVKDIGHKLESLNTKPNA